ncbi:BMP-binding endothelial regulator protein-like isoform X2 [Xenia sp. Carnegie-2017]|nr:BMP-binding endothelial regulator protein-like isoform X2 [Xenia sp. Carnegie-2017]
MKKYTHLLLLLIMFIKNINGVPSMLTFNLLRTRKSSSPEILGGRTAKCEKEGAIVDLPLVSRIPCMRCFCEGGVVRCKIEKCPKILHCNGIMVKKANVCCSECQESENCLYEGKKYENGDSWPGRQCTQCTCKTGGYSCKPITCNQHFVCPKGMKKGFKPGACCETCIEETEMCTSFGDPHYQTFDGRMYNFQGKCKYVFAKDCATNNFTIQVRNEGRHSRTFSWTKSVFLHYNGIEVALLQNLRVKVNGHAVGLPYADLKPDVYIAKESYLITVNTAIGVQVVWDGDSYTEVHVPKRYRNKTCGFCGNFNGDASDDFQTPDGEVKENTKEFAVSWQVHNNKMSSCDSNESGNNPPACRGAKLLHARLQCHVLKKAKFAKCHNLVNPRPHFQSCINDMCHCPRSQVHSCLCQSLTAYARACQRKGIFIQWRSTSSCGVKCKGGKVYDNCGPACRITCKNKDRANKMCTKPCVAGCQCPAGKVWHKRKCILPSKCPK